MDNRFFDRPILNSPYAYPGQHWELVNGLPTNRIEPNRRHAEFVSPIPKPQKRKAAEQSWTSTKGMGFLPGSSAMPTPA